MFRMILLTLGALYGFLIWSGTPELNPAATAASRTRAWPVEASREPAPATIALTVPASGALAGPPQPYFPGPPLAPSPEHAGGLEAAAASLVVTGEAVSLRAGPGPDHRRIGPLARGVTVTALGPTGGAWIEVRDTSGRRGYVSAKFLSPNQPG